MKIAIVLESPIGDFNLLRYRSIHRSVILITSLTIGRAPEPDGTCIPSELLKCAIYPVANGLHSLFTQVWRSGRIPADWRDGILIALYKGKGTKS